MSHDQMHFSHGRRQESTWTSSRHFGQVALGSTDAGSP